MTVPETAMDKYTGPKLGQYNVGISSKVLPMNAEAVAMSVQKFPDDQFWIGILASDTAHHAGSRGGVDDVHFVISQNSVVS
jgi:hypothetical protein